MRRKNTTLIYICVIFISLLLFLMLTIYASATHKSTAFSGRISAKAAALYEPTEKRFIYSKNGKEQLPMASTTKIMTAIVVNEHCSMDDVVIIGPESVGIEGSSAYLREGDKYTVKELLYALMLQSANDAATALAYYTAGSIDEFSTLMNSKGKALGLENTNFTNPHGLDDYNHYTTAEDLAIIGAHFLDNKELSEIAATYKKTFTYDERTRTYINHNKLLHRYNGCIGLKTGFTKRCGRCLVGAAERDGVKLVCVTLDAPSDWNDQSAMLDHGFEILESVPLCRKGDFKQRVPVVGGEKASISISAKQDLSIIKEKCVSIPNKITYFPRYVIAPVRAGDVIGSVVYKIEGKKYSVDLVAEEDIAAKDNSNSFLQLIKKFFK